MEHGNASHAERTTLAALLGLTTLSAVLLVWQCVMPRSLWLGPFTIDRLGALMGLLVAWIGAATYRFALRYLAGEPGQRGFLRWLAATIVAAFALMFTTHLLALFATWFLVSLGLHQLLTLYRDRPEAQRPARKKFLISRFGDVALLAAIGVVWWGWGTFDLRVFLDHSADGERTAASTAVALLVVVAALTKSAQFPFHSWLPETMEAPTPVSALMHAGIINAGGVLLLRFAPLLAHQPISLVVLALLGTLTAALGTLAAWAQPDVKRTLAWSTVSQMGFMMVQCGLGAFPVAALHIIGHGCYKAWSFLHTGQLPAPAAPKPATRPARALVIGALGTALAAPVLGFTAWLTGFDPLHVLGELALMAVVALSIGQLWVALLGPAITLRRALAAALLTPGVALLACALYRGAALFLMPVFGPLRVVPGPLAFFAALLPVLTLVALAALHAYLPLLGRTPAGRALQIHALNGFYIGTIANRLVDRVWSVRTRPAPAPLHTGALAPEGNEHA